VLDARARGYVRTTARALFLLAACAPPLAAQTNDPLFAGWRWAPPSVGSRPAGMGGAFVGMADDAKAAVVNPAGLTLIPITRRSESLRASPGPRSPWGRGELRLAGFVSRAENGHVELEDVAPGRVGSLDSSVGEAGLALGFSLTQRLKLGGSVATTKLSLDGQRRVPGEAGTEQIAASVTSDDTHVRAGAGLLLVLLGANARALPSLRLGVSWQPGFDWAAEMSDETEGARTIAFRRPTLVSTGLAWRASDRWSIVAQGDIVLYSEVLASLERNIGEAALDFSLPSTVEPRIGGEFVAPLWCGCGVVRLRGGLHYRSPGTLRYLGPTRCCAGPSPRRAGGRSRRSAPRYGGALRQRAPLDVDVRDVFEGPTFLRHGMEVLSRMLTTAGVAARSWPCCRPSPAVRHTGRPDVDASKQVARGCPPERALNGEVRLVFLGDSGYGEGFSEWGTHGQDAIAQRLAQLTLPPDLVFFLGGQHLLAWQRRPLQVPLRRRLRPADSRLQGPRGARQPRHHGLPRRRAERALGVVPAGAVGLARRGPQGALHAAGHRGGRGGSQGGSGHCRRERG
jgi:hypothetical protein